MAKVGVGVTGGVSFPLCGGSVPLCHAFALLSGAHRLLPPAFAPH